jgi:GxxExxY protein
MIQENKIIYHDLSYKVNGILFKVRKDLGQYRNEKQYCDAIEQQLKINKLNYEREKVLDVSFEGERPGRNKADFVIEGKIILEVKAKPMVTTEDYYQIRRYLASTNLKLGILANMRRYAVNPKRILNSEASE